MDRLADDEARAAGIDDACGRFWLAVAAPRRFPGLPGK